ncbi:hypothetical protein TcasGA2_TC002773 [Tribolium castaneum]|uniref:Uncharacterized protein n=1 Tax=Tribolium castaneum TaxID=7070 RepID=D6WDH2_TRICA|nr:hypothetical protein TcasGA2_TC002773 [Tribolium castaneum]
MANLSTENLFLLEFLVEELNMITRCDCGAAGEVCVSFQFLDNEPLEVCEGDFNTEMKFGEKESSKTGKSVLFSLTPAQAQKVLQSFDITVSVIKKMPPGWEPQHTSIGSTKVSILPIFFEIMSSKETDTEAKVHQDTYSLTDGNGMNVGKIGVYIRLSCYGKMIITQFQMNMDDKSVLFKDKDGRSLYRYKKSKKGKSTKIEDMTCAPRVPPKQQSQQRMYGQYPPMQSQFGQFGQPMNQMGFPPPNPNCPMQPCFPPGGYGQQPAFAAKTQSKSGCSGPCSRY